MDSLHLEFDVAGNNFSQAGMASDQVKLTLKKMGVPTEDIRRVAIAMYEGEINMVIHGGGGKAIIEIYPDHIDIKLIDHGKGIENIELAMTPGYSTAEEEVRSLGFGAGMGLPNMKKYADVLNVESEVNVGTTVSMQVCFN